MIRIRPKELHPQRPLLLLNGGLDDNVRPAGARALAERLRPIYDASGGGPLVHTEYPGMTHFPNEREWDEMWTTATRFLGSAFEPGEGRSG